MAIKSTPIVAKLEEEIMLQVNQPTEEQEQQDKTRQESLNKSVMEKLKGDSIQEAILKDLGTSPETDVIKKKSFQEEEESVASDEESLEEESENDNSEEQEQEDEEVIPKSKVQKRFDELTAKNKALETNNKELEKRLSAIERAKESPKDEITRQLEGMSNEQLKAAKIEVRKAQIKSMDDDTKLNELLELENKIDAVINDAPKNFANAQKDAYMRKAAAIAESGDIPDMEKAAPQITKLAGEIYSAYPSLQKDINGQAIALDLAAKHFKALNSVPGDRTKETELKRQVNTLKRKTTLDTKTGKVNIDKTRLDSLRKNAINGNMSQKVELVRNHPMFNVDKMIPDEFKN